MKKILAILMALCLVFSMAALVGCAKEEAPAGGAETPAAGGETQKEDTANVIQGGDGVTSTGESSVQNELPTTESGEADLENALPNQYVPEKLAAGMEVLVAAVHLQLGDQLYVMIDDALKNMAEDLGYVYASSSMDDDLAKGIQLIENYVQMGAASIVCQLNDPDAGVDICEYCEENGCYLSIVGAVPNGYISCAVNVDQTIIGTQQYYLASAWVDQQYPDAADGSIKVAFLGNTVNTDPAIRTYATEDLIKADPRMELVYTNHDARSLDKAFTAIEEAFTMDDGIRLCLTFNSTQAVGCNNKIMSLPNVNPEEYAVFCCSYNAETLELIEQSKTNASVLRGTIGFGGEAGPWDGYAKALFGLLDGTMAPGTVYWERIWAINEVGFEYDSQSA